MSEDEEVVNQASCPLASCRAIPGEPCWYVGEHFMRPALSPHFERRQVHGAKIKGEPLGLTNCTICGLAEQHGHSAAELRLPVTVNIEMPGWFVYRFDRTNPRHVTRLTSFLWRAADKMIATPSPETGTAAVPARFDGEDYLRAMPGGHTMPAGPAPEPVKPPATHRVCPFPFAPCECPDRDEPARTPAAGTAPKGEK